MTLVLVVVEALAVLVQTLDRPVDPSEVPWRPAQILRAPEQHSGKAL